MTFGGAATAITTYLNIAEPAAVDPPSLGGTPALSTTRTLLNARLDPSITIKAIALVPVFRSTPAPTLPAAPHRRAQVPPGNVPAAGRSFAGDGCCSGIASVTPNTAVLLQPNASFIEAYLVGLNEEFARELLWRQFPRGTPGDPGSRTSGARVERPDVPAIAQFDPNGHLGDHTQDHASPGRVVRCSSAPTSSQRYPNALFSAAPANMERRQGHTIAWHDAFDNSPSLKAALARTTGSSASISPTPSAIPPPPDPNVGDAGYYFVLEEHITEPRFGLRTLQGCSGLRKQPHLERSQLG